MRVRRCGPQQPKGTAQDLAYLARRRLNSRESTPKSIEHCARRARSCPMFTRILLNLRRLRAFRAVEGEVDLVSPRRRATSGVVLHISPQGLMQASTAQQIAAEKTEELRAAVREVDFTNTNQDELTHLAKLLQDAGELTSQEAALLVSAATDVSPARTSVERFNLMSCLSATRSRLAQEARSNRSLAPAARYASHAVVLFDALRSFGASDRPHLLP